MEQQTSIQALSASINTFVPELQKARRISGQTYAQLSDRSGVPLPNINKFFSGALADPKLYYSAAICKLLNFSLDEHFGIAATADSRLKGLTEKKEALAAEVDKLNHRNERLSIELESSREQLDFCKRQISVKENQLTQMNNLLTERADYLRLKDRVIAIMGGLLALSVLANIVLSVIG